VLHQPDQTVEDHHESMSSAKFIAPFVLLLPSAGGAWNHALYFRHFAPASSERANPGPSVSAELNNEFDRSFDGDVQEMKVAFTAAANRIFGSGWAWLCYTGRLHYSDRSSTTNSNRGTIVTRRHVRSQQALESGIAY
jgi:Fe-Mn family superoxide dismutase